MSDLIFLSYSRQDLGAVRELYGHLKTAGYSLWFDEECLLAGQDWEREIRRAIRESKAVLICLSSKWLNERGYVQKEMKLAGEVMKEMPEGQIHTIPVKLDDCSLPPSLARLHCIAIYETEGLNRLKKALDHALKGRASPDSGRDSQDIDAYTEFMEDVIAKGGLIHTDPWAEAQTEEELEFKRLLKGRWNKSLDYLSAKEYEAIIALWSPLQDNPYFKVDHTQWADRPFFRAQIHSAKSQLFMAYVQLGVGSDWEMYMPKAFDTLKEVLTGPPYSMKGGAPDRLPAGDALTQNLNYKQTLEFALDWLRGWGGSVLEPVGISSAQCATLEKRIRERLYEVDFMLEARHQSK